MKRQCYDKYIIKSKVLEIILIGLITLASPCFQSPNQFRISDYCEILENKLNETYIACPIENTTNLGIQNIIAQISNINFIQVEDNCAALMVNVNEINVNTSKAAKFNCAPPLNVSLDYEIPQLYEVTSNDKYNKINAIQPNVDRSQKKTLKSLIKEVILYTSSDTRDEIDDYFRDRYFESDAFRIRTNKPNLSIMLSSTYELRAVAICCNITSLNVTVLAQNDALQSLELSEHNFEHLTKESFLGVEKITDIKLVFNHIQSIDSDAFTQLTRLGRIHILYNRLVALPKGLFSNNTNLQLFKMLCDDIETLPNELFAHLPQLTRFIMRCNVISVPENLFAGSENIQVMDLSHNKLEALPLRLFHNMRNLSSLQLDHNFLTTLPDLLFKDMENLAQLKLSKNRFTTIYSLLNSVLNFQSIGYIDLSHNYISNIGEGDFVLVQHGAKVNLTSNLITEVDVSKINNTTLNNGIFILANNTFNCDCVKIRQIIEFKVHSSFSIDGLNCETSSYMSGRNVTSIHIDDVLCGYHAPSGCNYSVRTDERKRNLIMNCSNSKLTAVPKLPKSSKFDFDALELHIDYNSITEIPKLNTADFEHLTKIFARNNSIKQIIPENIPMKLTTLDLSNNRLKVIRHNTATTLNTTLSLQNISFRGNPWSCECDGSDSIISLLELVRVRIHDSSYMKCEDGTLAMQFHGQCSVEFTPFIIITASIAIIFAIIFSVLYYQNREAILVWFYANKICMCCISEDELDQDKQYDAFLSISPEDDDFAFDHLLHELECGPRPFRICWPVRDWMPGEFINQLIMDSVTNSCRTIIVLSPNFLKSIWGRMEFRAAHTNAMKDGISRLIVIPRFFEKLRYALPHRRRKSTGFYTRQECFHIKKMELCECQPDLLTNTGKNTFP